MFDNPTTEEWDLRMQRADEIVALMDLVTSAAWAAAQTIASGTGWNFDVVHAYAVQLYREREQQLRTECVLAYASSSDVYELADLLAFYRTPTGRKMMATQNEFNQALASAITPIGVEVAEELVQALQ